jgi:serine/threonine protein phosphatase PrpC
MKVYSHSLQGKRDANEDQHIHVLNLNGENNEYNNINFFGVFDGHGGKLVSKYLKETMPQFFITKFKKNLYTKDISASKYFIKVYGLLQSKLQNDHPKGSIHCGSTACIGIHYKDKCNHDKLWILNVGDSRAIKCNKDNIAEQLTLDHKPNNPEEKIRIERLGGKIQFDGSDWRINGLSVSRAFGDLDCSPYVTHLPQIYKYNINPNDKFIIFACDGLWDVLSNQDVIDYINELLLNKKFKGNYSKELAKYAIIKGSLDNISVIVYFI